MEIRELGEEGLIRYMKGQFLSKCTTVGIGDDCAVIPNSSGKVLLITTDALVENVHFIRSQISARDLGYKAIAVNVSDIAAMGGTPSWAVLTLALPKSTSCQWLFDFCQGLKDACHAWNIELLGGDTVGSEQGIFINLTLTGHVSLQNVKYRHEANIDDVIAVTGSIGDAAAGFKALQEKITRTQDVNVLIQNHQRPRPHLQEGKWLASHGSVHAMMDLSDGLCCDLQRLLQSSAVGAIVETTQIPISSCLQKVCHENGWQALDLAIAGGEDYCLLVTIAADAFDTIQIDFKNKFGLPLYAVGRICPTPPIISYTHDGHPITLTVPIYSHFD